jgi:hypothetical protein
MKTKIVTLSVLALATLGLFAVANTQVYAYQGDYTKSGPDHTEEREAAMEKVMTTNDYEGWKNLMTEDGKTPGVLRKIDTKEEFTKFAEAYKLGHAGKTAEANAIRTELGLGNGGGNGGGNGSGNRGAGNGTCTTAN